MMNFCHRVRPSAVSMGRSCGSYQAVGQAISLSAKRRLVPQGHEDNASLNSFGLC